MPFAAAIPLITAGAGLLGRLFGNAGKGSADQRNQENNQRIVQQNSLNSDALQRANLELNQRQFQQNEPNAQASQAVRGSLLQHLQPLQMQGLSSRVNIPRMNSIIDALGPEARQAGALLSQRGVSGLQAGPTQFSKLPPQMLPSLQPQNAGLLEKILGGVGLVGSTVGALGDLNSLGQSPQPQAPYAAQPRPFNPYEVEPD